MRKSECESPKIKRKGLTDGGGDVGGGVMGLLESLLQMRGAPYGSQRALPSQNCMRIKHPQIELQFQRCALAFGFGYL